VATTSITTVLATCAASILAVHATGLAAQGSQKTRYSHVQVASNTAADTVDTSEGGADETLASIRNGANRLIRGSDDVADRLVDISENTIGAAILAIITASIGHLFLQ
jgi:hypothetical protein